MRADIWRTSQIVKPIRCPIFCLRSPSIQNSEMSTQQSSSSSSQFASSRSSNHNEDQRSPEEMMFPECQCGQTDALTGAPALCPLHYVHLMTVGRPAMSVVAHPFPTAHADGSGPNSPSDPSPTDRCAYRFTPPMSLENFPRPSSINRGESLATVLEERYQVCRCFHQLPTPIERS